MNLSAFKSYDIRGVYPTEVNEVLAASVARAFAHHLNADRIVLGMDARESSPALHAAVVKALTSMGVDVYNIGLCSTPLLNYAVVSKEFPGGIMLSASHNPKEYNALKLIKAGIQISSPGELDAVKRLVESPSDIKPVRDAVGQVFTLDVLTSYLTELADEFVSLKNKGLRIAVDYSNGMGSVTAVPLFSRLGIKVISLNEKVDCTFPAHPANPSEDKNLEWLRRAVVENAADCGIFFDGDADRSFIIDEHGNTVYPDILFAILAEFELAGRSEKRVYYDLRFSRVVADVVRQHHGEPIMMRVGNPFYKEKLKNDGGVFAAEFSGHIMFQDHYCIDDGLYAALKVLNVMVDAKTKLSELSSHLMKYYATPELNFKVQDADATMKKVSDSFQGGERIDLDGVYISFPDWWFNLRKSNTEPLVRLRIEADTPQKRDEMKKKIVEIITS